MEYWFTFLTHHWMLSAALLGLMVALLINEIRHFSPFKAFSPQEVVNKMNHEHAKLIDCRGVETFRAGHILGAVNIPSEKLEESQAILNKLKTKVIIVVCDRGLDSPKFSAKLRKLGFSNVATLEGGIQSWKKEGLPIERG
jgi:rhodanese-related sulfurtransferase